MQQALGNCKHCACYCPEYVIPTSRWMKGKCKRCNHSKSVHGTVVSDVGFDQNKIAQPPKWGTNKVINKSGNYNDSNCIAQNSNSYPDNNNAIKLYKMYYNAMQTEPDTAQQLVAYGKTINIYVRYAEARQLMNNSDSYLTSLVHSNNMSYETKHNIQQKAEHHSNNIVNVQSIKVKKSYKTHCYCYCGKIMRVNESPTAPNQFCLTCCEYINNGMSFWCSDGQCDFIKTNGFGFCVCADCAQQLKGLKKQCSELLKISLDIARMKMEQLKNKHQDINAFLTRFELTKMPIVNYFRESQISRSVYNELVECFESVKNDAFSHIAASIDKQHSGVNIGVVKYLKQEEKHNINVEPRCNSLSECLAAGCLSETLILYGKKIIDLSNESLFVDLFRRQYSIISVLNNFIHVLEYHDLFECYETFSPCAKAQCKASKRRFLSQKLYRNDFNSKMTLNIIKSNNMTNSDIVLLEYFDLIHSYFRHDSTQQSLPKDAYNKFGSIVDNKKQQQMFKAEGIFSFGKKFWYWPYFRSYPTYIASPNHKSLKQEMLRNKYCSIQYTQFNLTLQKALKLIETNKARQIKAMFNGANHMYEIPADLCITISHIMVLLFYCNYYEVQGKFKGNGTRKWSPEEDWINDVMPRHKEVANFFKLMTEAVIFFGQMVPEQITLYHGLNLRFVFNQFKPHFESPFSATTSIDIAYEFTKQKGVIIGLSSVASSSNLCFNVEWLSAYPNQKERLFAKSSGLNIVDIRIAPDIYGMNNTLNISAIRLFDNIFGDVHCANFFIISMGEKRETIQQRLIEFLIQYQSNFNKRISQYPFDLFCCLVGKKMKCDSQTLYVMESDFKCLSSELQYKLQELMILFKKNRNLKIEYIDEYIYDISADDLIDFKQLQEGKNLYGAKETYITSTGKKIEFCPMISKSLYRLSDFTGFGILPLTENIIVDVSFSFVVEEANFTQGPIVHGAVGYMVPVNVASFRQDLLNKISCFTIKFGVRFKECVV